jgi:hypothetical protein
MKSPKSNSAKDGAAPKPKAKAAKKSAPEKKGTEDYRDRLPKDPKTGVVLLSGGNPQIPKGDGDAPVQAYIAAMPEWKRGIGRKLDALIERVVPKLSKAVRWNSPFYGVEGQGWFLGTHCLTKYVKVTFFAGKSLKPMPPGGTPKSGETRWIDIPEGGFDEAQMEDWIKQAATLPGWKP